MTTRAGRTAKRHVRLVPLLTCALLLQACEFFEVDAPISFRADRRLEIVAPESGDHVDLPVTVEWTVEDFPLTDGNHFGVFVDKLVPQPKEAVRLEICAQSTSFAGVRRCRDERERVFFTTDTSMTFDCFEPVPGAPRRRRYDHTVSVVLLNGDNVRVGQAAYTVSFTLDEDQAERCRGF